METISSIATYAVVYGLLGLAFVLENWKAVLGGTLLLIAVIWWFKTKRSTRAPLAAPPVKTNNDFALRPLRRLWGSPDKDGIVPPAFFLGPISAHLWFGLAILAASIILVVVPFATLVAPLSPEVFFEPLVFWVLSTGLVIMTNLLAWLTHERRTVPNNHVLPLTVLGRVINVVLTNGEYLIPLNPILSTNKDNVTGDVVLGSQENKEGENRGLIYVGTVTVHLGAEGQDGQGLMSASAFDKAVVKIRPTLSYRCTNPLQRLGRNSPIKDMNQSGRDTVRKILAGITTADQANDLHSAIAKMLFGKGFYGVRARKSDAKLGVHGGNLVTYADNGRIICIVNNDEVEDLTKKEEIAREVAERGNPDMVTAALNNGQLEPFFLNVAAGLRRALVENGYVLDGEPRIGEIELPKPVSDAAAAAAAEVPQRAAALADAETARQVGKVLTEDGAGLTGVDAAWAGIARENPNVRIVHVPGLKQGGGNVIINPSTQ